MMRETMFATLSTESILTLLLTLTTSHAACAGFHTDTRECVLQE